MRPFRTICIECDRVFDLLDETDASEWAYGHDCEAPPFSSPQAIKEEPE